MPVEINLLLVSFSLLARRPPVQMLGGDALLALSARGCPVHVLHQEKARPASGLGGHRQAPGPAGMRREAEQGRERGRHVRERSLASPPVLGVPGDWARGPGGVQVPFVLPGALHAHVSLPPLPPVVSAKRWLQAELRV